MGYTYAHPRPAVTVDCVVFGYDHSALKVLLIKRAIDPFKGTWALPGGGVRADETLDDAARRELEEGAGLSKIYLEQLYTFDNPKRDPRGHTITVAYYALVKLLEHRVRASTNANDAKWCEVARLPKLPFDHGEILEMALERLKGKVRYQPIGFELLPPKFTLTQLQNLYETVLETVLDKRNFRKKITATELLSPLRERQTGVSHRAAQLFSFNERKYRELKKQGFNFEL